MECVYCAVRNRSLNKIPVNEFDHNLTGIFSILEQMLSWYPRSAMHCAYSCSPPKCIKIWPQCCPQTKNTAQMLTFFPPLRNSSNPLTTLLSSFHNPLPCLQHTFTRRTSGHCLGALAAVYSLSLRNIRRSASHCRPTPPTHFLSVSVAISVWAKGDELCTTTVRSELRTHS
jgi:hypothetical protein